MNWTQLSSLPKDAWTADFYLPYALKSGCRDFRNALNICWILESWSQPISRSPELQLRLTPNPALSQRRVHTDESDGCYKTHRLQSPSFLSQTLQRWLRPRNSGIQSPSHWISSLAVLPLFLQEGTGNTEVLPSTSLLNTLKQQWHKSTQSNTQDQSVPVLLRDTWESLLILPQLQGRTQPSMEKARTGPPVVVKDKKSSGIWWNSPCLELEWGHMDIQLDAPPPVSRRQLQIFRHHWV